MAKGQTADLILDAGVACLAQCGPEGASVRTIAERAGVAAPTLQHHYRSKADLLLAVYAYALEQHLRISAGVLGALALAADDAGPDAIRCDLVVQVVAALEREWLDPGGPADHTAVVLHLLVHAVRDPAYSALAGAWLEGVAAALQQHTALHADEAVFATELLIGVALASGPVAFRRESAVLNDDVMAFAFGRRGAASGCWLEHFRSAHAEAGDAAMVDGVSSGDVRRAILDAGVTLAAESGADALSVRKVAARAGVAPSSVIYHFPDRQALLTALYRGVHQRFMAAEPLEAVAEWPRLTVAGAHSHMVDVFTYMIVEQAAGAVPLFLTSCELFLVGWREPDLAPEAFVMRLERGGFGRQWHGDREEAQIAHVHSLWSMGLALARFSRPSADRAEEVRHRLVVGMDLMAARAA